MRKDTVVFKRHSNRNTIENKFIVIDKKSKEVVTSAYQLKPGRFFERIGLKTCSNETKGVVLYVKLIREG